jgi:hypothetical protein
MAKSYADLPAGSAIMEQVDGDAIYQSFEEYAGVVDGTYTPEDEEFYGRFRWNNQAPDEAITDEGALIIIGIGGGHPEPPRTPKA